MGQPQGAQLQPLPSDASNRLVPSPQVAGEQGLPAKAPQLKPSLTLPLQLPPWVRQPPRDALSHWQWPEACLAVACLALVLKREPPFPATVPAPALAGGLTRAGCAGQPVAALGLAAAARLVSDSLSTARSRGWEQPCPTALATHSL